MAHPSSADRLLGCALAFRDAPRRDAPLPARFASSEEAIGAWLGVLLHEAHESMRDPLEGAPDAPFLHPVDLDTEEPGIVDSREEVRIRRPARGALPRIAYAARLGGDGAARRGTAADAAEAAADAAAAEAAAAVAEAVFAVEPAAAEAAVAKAADKELRAAQRRAATAERREERQRVQREARAAETPEERAERLATARAARAERAAAKAATAAEAGAEAGAGAGADASPPPPPPPKKRPRAPPPPPSEDALVSVDVSARAAAGAAPARRPRGVRARYFEHPLPHDRHLQALGGCAPAPHLLGALLGGAPCDDLEVVQGPPGTGKTRALVARLDGLPAPTRVLLCAPTNVGAANLYRRVVAAGWGAEASLALAADRVPPGTVVLSNDPARRLVCATVSARAGGALRGERFEAVLVDEAALCMEAWVWTLLRPEVARLVLAGDVHQLPARVSESGRALRHDRSLMERLVCDLGYENVATLDVQNRMAPELLALPNAAFYGGALATGPHAPPRGEVVVVRADGAEEACGTSHRNRAEADAAAAYVRGLAEDADAVLLAPYRAQCALLLARATGREVHTVDSFQGREADTVVLCAVRDGAAGLGFWSDARRAAVALTRARTRLVLVCSHPEAWPADAPLRRLALGGA